MRVLLVKPSNLSDHIQPSLGLGYLATAIRNRHEVRILDCLRDGIQNSDVRQVVEEFRPDVVGIQSYTFDLGRVREVLVSVKSARNPPITVLGGPHPSTAPEDCFQRFSPNLDFVMMGECEIGFPLLLDHLAGKGVPRQEVPGLAWRDNGSVRRNPTAHEEDLDKLGMPAWDLIRPDLYPPTQHGIFHRRFPVAPIMATRGCPYLCTFCGSAGTKLRKRSAGLLLEEVKLLYHTYGVREFLLVDDNFTLDPKYATEFLELLKKENLDAAWCTPNGVRLDRLNPSILKLMKECGFYAVSVGIESGSDEILARMKKGTTTEKIRKNLKMVRQQGIDVCGFFILGFPGERPDTIEQTIRFACELDLTRASFFTYIPLPATESWRELEKEGEISRVAWEDYYLWGGAYAPKGMTRPQLLRYQRKAFLKFYMRPKIWWRNRRAFANWRIVIHAGLWMFKRFFPRLSNRRWVHRGVAALLRLTGTRIASLPAPSTAPPAASN